MKRYSDKRFAAIRKAPPIQKAPNKLSGGTVVLEIIDQPRTTNHKGPAPLARPARRNLPAMHAPSAPRTPNTLPGASPIAIGIPATIPRTISPTKGLACGMGKPALGPPGLTRA